MLDLLEQFTGLDFSLYDENLVFLFVGFVTILIFDVAYGILHSVLNCLMGKRR